MNPYVFIDVWRPHFLIFWELCQINHESSALIIEGERCASFDHLEEIKISQLHKLQVTCKVQHMQLSLGKISLWSVHHTALTVHQQWLCRYKQQWCRRYFSNNKCDLTKSMNIPGYVFEALSSTTSGFSFPPSPLPNKHVWKLCALYWKRVLKWHMLMTSDFSEKSINSLLLNWEKVSSMITWVCDGAVNIQYFYSWFG